MGRQVPGHAPIIQAIGGFATDAAQAQNHEFGAGIGHAPDQAAGIDVLSIVGRVRIGQGDPEASHRGVSLSPYGPTECIRMPGAP